MINNGKNAIAQCVQRIIVNEAGTEVDWDHAAALMDEGIWAGVYRNFIGNEKTYDEFWADYCAAHRAVYGREFEPNTHGYSPKGGLF